MNLAVIIPANIVELFLTCYFWFSLLERRYSKKVSMLIYFPVQFLSAIRSWMFFDQPTLKIIITTAISMILLFILFKDKWYKKVATYVIYLGCVILGECLSVILAKYVFNSDLSNPTAATMGNFMWQITAYMISYTFVLIAMMLMRNKTIDPEERVTQYVCFYVAVQCMVIFIFTILAFEYNVVSNALYIVMTIVLFSSLLLAFSIYNLVKGALVRIAKAEFIKKEAEIKDKHFREIKEQYVEFRRLRHDFVNHMKVIESLDDTEKLKEYVRDVKSKLDSINQVSYCNNLTVDALLSLKRSEAGQNGIKISYSVCSLEDIGISDFDLCTVIGNLLDNAIEGASKCEEKYIDLRILRKIGRILVVVKNSSVPVTAPFNTTKSDKEAHGIGIGNIREISEKYEGEAVFKYENGEFSGIVSLAYQK